MTTIDIHRVRKGRRARVAGAGYIEVVEGAFRKLEHIVVAERALGRPLPKGSIVHHVNEVRSDNRPGNLVICPSIGYHKLIHMRMRAREICGNANWIRCQYCKQYDDPKNMYVYPSRNSAQHRACHASRALKLWRAKHPPAPR